MCGGRPLPRNHQRRITHLFSVKRKMELKENNALELWKKTLRHIIEKGEEYKDNDGRTCREMLNIVMTLTDTKTGFELPIDEMRKSKIWIYPSKEELSNIMFKEKQAPIYEYTYGGRMFNFSSQFDQINDFIIPLLKKDPDSRRAVVMIYDPIQDSAIFNRNIPGIIYMQFRVKDNKLFLNASIRSNDVFFGWPANIFQLVMLNQYLAKELKVESGSVSVLSNSAHIFMEDVERMREVIGDLS